jgi:hypothetical protein
MAQSNPHKKRNPSITDDWRGHELVTKAIFEALLRQSAGDEHWEIEHNKQLVGLATTHQIDVYWKFRMAGLEHLVIVQVKREKGRTKKSDMLAFKGVLMDIPGQPKGVFVSQAGYQKGALEVARSSGITAFQLREVDQRDPAGMTLTSTSIGHVVLRRDIMAFEITVLTPHLMDNLTFTLDKEWNAQHHIEMPLTPNLGQIWQSKFVDDCGSERTSLHKLMQDLRASSEMEGKQSLISGFKTRHT